MYGVEFEVDEAILDAEYTIPIGEAKIMREGTDVTITTYARMVGVSLEAAEVLQKEHGINVEVNHVKHYQI